MTIAERLLNTPILSMPEMKSYLTFRGGFESGRSYLVGDVVTFSDGSTCVCTDPAGAWDKICDYEPTYSEPPKIKYSHCKSCGAPVKSYRNSCEYCGTEYERE